MFCCYVIQERSWQKNHILASLILRMCRLQMTKRYWSNTVGQYSLLHACIQFQSKNSCFSCLWPHMRIRSFLTRTSMATHRDLPDSVKVAISSELKGSLGDVIRCGKLYYDPDQFALVASMCRIGTPRPTIRCLLIVHVATTICGWKPPGPGQEEKEASVAATLSIGVLRVPYMPCTGAAN